MNTWRLLRYGIMNDKTDIANEIFLIFSKFIYDEIVEYVFGRDY